MCSGAGYVGVSTAALLSFENDVILYDIDCEKVKKINEDFVLLMMNYLNLSYPINK